MSARRLQGVLWTACLITIGRCCRPIACWPPTRLSAGRRSQCAVSQRRCQDLAAGSTAQGPPALVSASRQALLHMVAESTPATPVIFLDTGRLFAQTLLYRNELARRLRSRTFAPHPRAARGAGGSDSCWPINPDMPLIRAPIRWTRRRTLFRSPAASYQASTADPHVARCGGRIAVNPLADWTAEDVARYLADHDLPPHPMVADGYPSIGCIPCTSRVVEGEDGRAGRWRGKAKVECGIHVSPEKSGSGI